MRNKNQDLFWACIFGLVWLIAIYALVRHLVYFKFSWAQVGQGILWVIIIGLITGDLLYRYFKQRRIDKERASRHKK